MMIGQLESMIWKSATAPAHFRSASVEAWPDDVETRPFETTLGFIAAARSPQIGSAAPVHAGRHENAAVRTRASQQATTMILGDWPWLTSCLNGVPSRS